MNNNMVVDARWYYKGNIKVGNIATFSKLPGDQNYVTEKYGIVQGSCSPECCKYCNRSVDGKRRPCFVYKSHRYPSVIESQARNTLSVRNDPELAYHQLSVSMQRKRKKPVAGRVDQSGELLSRDELVFAGKMSAENSYMPFYLYTKKYGVAIDAISDKIIPSNMFTLISIWHEQGIREYLSIAHNPNVKAFVYCDKNTDPINGWGVEEYAQHGIIIQTFCKAYNMFGKMNHGITCDVCKKCFVKKGCFKVIGCMSH